MNNISKKHHYIPEFYLKGFAKEGMFSIFDKDKNQFKQDAKKFATSSHFFEMDANTTYLNDEPNDFVEKGFQELDNQVATVFNKLKIGESPLYNITPDERYILQYFAAILFWRLPSNEILLKYLIQNKRLGAFGLAVFNSETNEKMDSVEFENQLKANPNFFTFLRAMLPGTSFPLMFGVKNKTTLLTFPEGLPAICGDNPLILRHPQSYDVHRDEFILPLNKNVVLLRHHRDYLPFMTSVRAKIDILVYAQSKKYVSTTDAKYLIMVKAVFKNDYKNDIEKLRSEIFNEICGPYQPFEMEDEIS